LGTTVARILLRLRIPKWKSWLKAYLTACWSIVRKEFNMSRGKKRKSKTTRRRSKAGPLDDVSLKDTSSAKADEQLGADQVVQILVDCIPRSGGNGNQVQLSKVLQWYGFDDQHQIDVLNSWIIGNSDYGVTKYRFHLAADALNFANPSTPLSEMADAIEDKATPIQQTLPT
jgi:hypothetical protein